MTESISSKTGWTTVAFGDVVRKVTDKVDPDNSGLERYVAGEHMDTDDLNIRRWGEIGDDYLGPAFHMRFKPGQVLYGSRRTYLRKVALADFEGITANTTYVFESKNPEILMPELLPFIMQTESFHEHSIRESKGSVNPYVNFSDLAWYEFALPPLEEQRRIAGVLQATEHYLNSLIELRASGKDLLGSFSVQEFSRITENGTDELGKFYERRKDQFQPEELSQTDLPLIGPEHIAKGTGNFLDTEFDKASLAMSNKFLFDQGDVLYSRIRPNFQKVVIAPFKGVCSTEIYPLIPVDELNRDYFLQLLLSREFTRFALSGMKGTGFPRVSHDYLAKFRINLPRISDQKNFLCRILPLRNLELMIEARISQLKAMKQTVFSGLEI